MRSRVPPSLRRSTSRRRRRRSRPTGGGATGGLLAPGTYYPLLHVRQRGGGRDVREPVLGAVHGDGGRDPAGHAPPLPGGVSPGGTTAYNIYLSGPSADPTSVIRYAAGVTTSTFNLAGAAATGDTVGRRSPRRRR